MYVPVKTLHLSCALLLSIKLFLAVDQTGCAFPTFNELGFICSMRISGLKTLALLIFLHLTFQ